MDLKIEKVTDKNNEFFPVICEWLIHWWGKEYKKENVMEFVSRCLNEKNIPQTYVALLNDVVVGMYQIDMFDDIDTRPDYYPWLVNVFVDETYRGNGICAALMEHAKTIFKDLNLKIVYLHTRHHNLYEKYGWKYLEEVKTLNDEVKRIYYFDI